MKRLKSEIPTRSKECCKCMDSFEPGQKYFSTLLDGRHLIRKDSCSACLEEAENSLSSWSGRIPLKDDKPPVFEDRDSRLYDKLMLSLESDEHAVAVMAAQYLARRGLLQQRGRYKKEGSLLELYERLDDGEAFAIPVIQLTSQEAVKAKESLTACWQLQS